MTTKISRCLTVTTQSCCHLNSLSVDGFVVYLEIHLFTMLVGIVYLCGNAAEGWMRRVRVSTVDDLISHHSEAHCPQLSVTSRDQFKHHKHTPLWAKANLVKFTRQQKVRISNFPSPHYSYSSSQLPATSRRALSQARRKVRPRLLQRCRGLLLQRQFP